MLFLRKKTTHGTTEKHFWPPKRKLSRGYGAAAEAATRAGLRGRCSGVS
jgi:hypothetical protein